MSKIDITQELLARHTDEEIVEYLYDAASSAARIFKVTSDGKLPAEYLWATAEGIYQIRDTLRALHKRNQERLAVVNKK